MDSEDLPDLAGRPREIADSEMADLVPEDADEVDVSGSTEDRGNSVPESDGSVAVDWSVGVLDKSSEPYFLRSVFSREKFGSRDKFSGRVSGDTLLVGAVHAVMQDSGFVKVDPSTGMPTDRLCHAGLDVDGKRSWSRFSASYSLPWSDSLNMCESVTLTFMGRGRHFGVSGYLDEAKEHMTVPCSLLLDVSRFGPAINLMRAIGDRHSPGVNAHISSVRSYGIKRVLEFWKMVKDGLALPLLIELTQRAGLPLPPCFMRLPKELKLKIFELLNGSDLARVRCVCYELSHLRLPSCFTGLLSKLKLEILDSLRGSDLARAACVCKELRYLRTEISRNRRQSRLNRRRLDT